MSVWVDEFNINLSRNTDCPLNVLFTEKEIFNGIKPGNREAKKW